MARSGYSDDYDDENGMLAMYRGWVASAMRGKRGQAFFRDLIAALDAMPVKRLIAHELEADGEVCALGALGKARAIDMSKLDPDDADTVGATFNIAEQLARETVWENDEVRQFIAEPPSPADVVSGRRFNSRPETPEERWSRMRAWAVSHLSAPQQPAHAETLREDG